AGMSGNTAKHAGVLILHLALDHSPTERAVVSGGEDGRPPIRRRVDCAAAHAHRTENFPLAKAVEWLVRNALESGPENNEADVAVFRSCPRIRSDRSCDCPGEQFLTILNPVKKLFVSDHPGRVPYQHANRNLRFAGMRR